MAPRPAAGPTATVPAIRLSRRTRVLVSRSAAQALAAAISFAGGRGSRSAGMICGDMVLVDLPRQLGTTSRVPMLWVHANNNGFFSPTLAHRSLNAFLAGGGNVAFIEAPALGDDGHYAQCRTPYVGGFLRAQNLLPHAASGAALPQIALSLKPPLLITLLPALSTASTARVRNS